MDVLFVCLLGDCEAPSTDPALQYTASEDGYPIQSQLTITPTCDEADECTADCEPFNIHCMPGTGGGSSYWVDDAEDALTVTAPTCAHSMYLRTSV